LLTFKNFDVIKKYNNSTSYAMGITVLGEALRGKSVISTDWPRSDKPLSFSDKKAMQRKLNRLGFNVGGVDGVVGSGTHAKAYAPGKNRVDSLRMAIWNKSFLHA